MNIRFPHFCLVLLFCLSGLLAAPAAEVLPLPGAAKPAEVTIDLDFPGGTPKDLIAALDKVAPGAVNVILPEEASIVRIPAFKVKGVSIQKLFDALSRGSAEVEINPDTALRYAFRTDGNRGRDQVWSFSLVKRFAEPTSCRFYNLKPYLALGLTVDDITTAMITGWKMQMQDESFIPKLSYHKETGLLIVVARNSQFTTVDSAMKALLPPAPVPTKASSLEPEKKAP